LPALLTGSTAEKFADRANLDGYYYQPIRKI
jgi:hypothetical protein